MIKSRTRNTTEKCILYHKSNQINIRIYVSRYSQIFSKHLSVFNSVHWWAKLFYCLPCARCINNAVIIFMKAIISCEYGVTGKYIIYIHIYTYISDRLRRTSIQNYSNKWQSEIWAQHLTCWRKYRMSINQILFSILNSDERI